MSNSNPRRVRKEENEEKRLKPYREIPTLEISKRIERAKTQRLFLIHTSDTIQSVDTGPSITFTVLGSTGNVYEVTLCKKPRCSCPDATKGYLCKHFLFIMLKVVGLPSDSPLVYQSAYLTDELKSILQHLSERRASMELDVVANNAVRKQFKKLRTNNSEKVDLSQAERKSLEGDCPICFDSLGLDSALLTYCKSTCGTNFHSHCMKMWTSQNRKNPKCPSCRQSWIDVATGGVCKEAFGGDEGYTNLGALQGQSPNRDCSTYSGFHRRYRQYYSDGDY